MDIVQNTSLSLTEIPASRGLVEDLAAAGFISKDARNAALAILHPARHWGLWVARLLLVLGVTLVLSGIIYFFAFNWTQIPPLAKLGGLEAAILCCLAGGLFYGLERLSGQVLALCASVLVGVFLAIFGQIYQTGADAYQLFALWAVLILPWTALTQLAALWTVWLVVANLALGLAWEQAVMPSHEMEPLIFPILALFNGGFLALREYVLTKGGKWLEARWTRVILVIPVLCCAALPIFILIVDHGSDSIGLGALVGIVIHNILYVFYRYRRPDMWALAATTLSTAVLLDAVVFDTLAGGGQHHLNAVTMLLMGGATLAIFTGAVVFLRRIAATTENSHD